MAVSGEDSRHSRLLAEYHTLATDSSCHRSCAVSDVGAAAIWRPATTDQTLGRQPWEELP